MSEICYKNNFLKQVIAKIDFAQPLIDLTHDSLTQLVAEIRKRFPISEQGIAVQQTIEIDNQKKEGKTSVVEFPEWVFHGSERDKFVKINQNFIHVALKKYKSEKDFQDDLILPISQILSSRPETAVTRTGVRFINVFDFEKIDGFQKAKEYFTESISSHIAFNPKPQNSVRSVLTNEFLIDEIKLRVQSGFFNPDYPAIIKRYHFVLDIDAYIDYPHQINNIATFFKKFHKIIQDTFESSITQKLRDEVLNGE